MLTEVGHAFVLAVGFVMLALALACGDTAEPLPDIDATVAIRVVEERVAEATVESKLQAMAKTMAEATAQAVSTATPIPASPTPAPKISTDNSQSFGNSSSVVGAKSDLDSDGGPEQPTSQPSRPLPEQPKHLRLDSQLNKLVGQIGSRSTADIASSAPISYGDLVAVTARLSHNSSSTVEFLESVGAIVANIGADYVEAYTPVTVLVPLSERDGVLRVEAIIPPEPRVTDN